MNSQECNSPLYCRLQHALILLLVFSAGLLNATVLNAQQLSELAPFEIEYDVGNNLISAGVANLSLKRDGDEWVYSLTTTPSGIFKLTGKGKIQEITVINTSDEAIFKPSRYTFRQDEEAKRNVDAWFNWDDNELRYKARNKDMVTEEISDPILDRLSVTLAVMELLKTGFQHAELQVFDAGRIKTVVFQNEGKGIVSTPLGNFDVIQVRSYNRDGKRTRETVTQFAPKLDYVPVMFEHRKNGSLVARMTIKRLSTE